MIVIKAYKDNKLLKEIEVTQLKNDNDWANLMQIVSIVEEHTSKVQKVTFEDKVAKDTNVDCAIIYEVIQELSVKGSGVSRKINEDLYYVELKDEDFVKNFHWLSLDQVLANLDILKNKGYIDYARYDDMFLQIKLEKE